MVGDTVVVGGFYGNVTELAVPPAVGLLDAFVATHRTPGDPGWTLGFGGPACDAVFSLRSTGADTFTFSGMFSGTVDLGAEPHTSTAAPTRSWSR